MHCSSKGFFALREANSWCTYHYSVVAAVGVGFIYSVIQTFASIEKRHSNCVQQDGMPDLPNTMDEFLRVENALVLRNFQKGTVQKKITDFC